MSNRWHEQATRYPDFAAEPLHKRVPRIRRKLRALQAIGYPASVREKWDPATRRFVDLEWSKTVRRVAGEAVAASVAVEGLIDNGVHSGARLENAIAAMRDARLRLDVLEAAAR